MDKIRLGISSCLLGNPVRYDGEAKLNTFLKDTLGRFIDWHPVCPESECGLPVPREMMRLTGSPEYPRLVTVNTGIDHTDSMMKWSASRLNQLEAESLLGFIFKSRSPSSGIRDINIYDQSGIPYAKRAGIFAGAFMKRFPIIPVEDEERLSYSSFRENFFTRVFVLKRWNDLLISGIKSSRVVDFHRFCKLLLLAHSPEHYRRLGRFTADQKRYPPDEFASLYIKSLMDGLAIPTTARKNVNALQHVLGYLKDTLSPSEKAELIKAIDSYQHDDVPLSVPITLLNQYAKSANNAYLLEQIYLNPHPIEQMLRAHV